MDKEDAEPVYRLRLTGVEVAAVQRALCDRLDAKQDYAKHKVATALLIQKIIDQSGVDFFSDRA